MSSPTTNPATEAGPPSVQAERLEELFSRCQDELLGMLYYFLGSAEDARDALQESFLKCWRRRESLGGIENLRAWVFQVTLNTGRDMRSTAWRRHRRTLNQPEAEVIAQPTTHEADRRREEQLAAVRKALKQLRSEEQEVFLLRQNGELTYDEIAQSLKLPVGTVKTRMRLAIGKLREALEV
ncbi:MAG: RNA polymerase sigma factor [Pirellulales bacterium]|nr:RNA polymerase sigma factor [Pirellulales bacterium]